MKKRKTNKKNNRNTNNNNKNNNKFNIYIMVVSLLLAWLALTDILLITKYDILPIKFFIPALIVLLVIPIILIIFMLRKKTKIKIKGILSGISIIFSIILTIAMFYLNETFKFLDNLKTPGYMTENYSVIVLKESNYNTIEEVDTLKLGYFENEESNVKQATEKLKEKIKLNKTKYPDYTKLVESLYNNENEAIIIEESYRSIINEQDEDFNKKTRVLYTIEIQIKTEDITKNVNVNKDTFNIYISGIDTYGSISSVSRSDVNIIATVNPTTHQILLTTIPRDYYVQLDGTTGYKDKLTHAGIYGIEKSTKTLENLLNIEINYYIKVNFSSVQKLVDALGGVDVYSQYTFIGTEGSSFTKGYNRVNGVQALEFARTRKTVSGGDRTRGENQQALIQAMITKACSKEILTKYSGILNSLEGSFQTNMSTDKITDIIKKQIDEMKPWNITSISLDGSNASDYTYSYQHEKLYVMVPDETTIENAKTKINQVINGEILENSYQEANTTVNTPTKVTKPVEKKEEAKKEEVKVEKPEAKPTTEEKEEEKVETTPTETIKPEENKETTTNEEPKKEEVKEEEQNQTTEEKDTEKPEEKPTETVKPEENKETTTKEETKKEEAKEEIKTN